MYAHINAQTKARIAHKEDIEARQLRLDFTPRIAVTMEFPRPYVDLTEMFRRLNEQMPRVNRMILTPNRPTIPAYFGPAITPRLSPAEFVIDEDPAPIRAIRGLEISSVIVDEFSEMFQSAS